MTGNADSRAAALPAATDKAAAVQSMFDRIAPHYDRMNRLLTLGMDQRWRERTIDLLRIGANDLVADVACGTGDFAELCRRRGARTIGLDYAARMLSHAAARTATGPLVRADALALPLRSGSMDALVCGFALRNFTSLPPAFAEMARVLRGGGRIGLLEVSRPDNPIIAAGHSLYFDRFVPLVGRVLADARAYRYLPASTIYLPEWQQMRAMLQDAGFERIERERAMLGAVQIITAVRRPA